MIIINCSLLTCSTSYSPCDSTSSEQFRFCSIECESSFSELLVQDFEKFSESLNSKVED